MLVVLEDGSERDAGLNQLAVHQGSCFQDFDAEEIECRSGVLRFSWLID